MSKPEPVLDELVQLVRESARYQAIDEGLVRKVGQAELAKGRKLKEAVKTTRSKLHQVAVSYQETAIPYSENLKTLNSLTKNFSDAQVQSYCRMVMRQHASTAERLPILDSFFNDILLPLSPIHSVLDLACGLNPLARPWMPLEKDASYFACDIFSDLVAFINQFFSHFSLAGAAEMGDLTQAIPEHTADVAFLLKSIPCLEQLDKNLVPVLLSRIPARHIVVSFPVQSLGGHQKGMAQFYGSHFENMIRDLPYNISTHSFKSELVYVLSIKE